MKKNISVIAILVVSVVIFRLLSVGHRGVAGKESFIVRACVSQSDQAKKKQCWERAIRKELSNANVSGAFELVAAIHDSDASATEACHGLMHLIGGMAYELYAKNQQFKLTDKTAYCSYGFFHEFMNKLIPDKKDPAFIQGFCDWVGQELAQASPDAKGACFHGVGHGATDEYNAKYYGNERAMIAPALSLCEQVARNKQELLRCTTGVFDSISLGYYNRTNGLIMRKDDPLWLCREQKESFKEACYRDMMPAILWLGKYRFELSYPYVIKFVEDRYKTAAIKTLASDSMRDVMRKGEAGFLAYLTICRTLPVNLSLPCAEGLAGGIMEFGLPNKAHILGLSVCRDKNLTSSEKDICLRTVVRFVRSRYNQKQADAICQNIEKEYTKFCQ